MRINLQNRPKVILTLNEGKKKKRKKQKLIARNTFNVQSILLLIIPADVLMIGPSVKMSGNYILYVSCECVVYDIK